MAESLKTPAYNPKGWELMPGNPHDCRDYAKDSLRLANEATTPEAKTHFEKLAYQWMELATDLDQTAVLMAQWGGPTKEGR